jgi:hypothetical protein
MDKEIHLERIVVLFIPFGLAMLFENDPLLSYFIAWLGSFLIFFITLTGKIKPIPTDRSFAEQIMRPVILVQLIFAGYMCCTSIFYLMNTYGYENFKRTSDYFLVDSYKLRIIAQCQRYYVLGHASFITGILTVMDYTKKPKYKIEIESVANLLLYAAILTLPLSVVFSQLPGLSQFSNQFNSLSFIAGTLALAFAIPQKKAANTAICLFLYFSNFYSALTSGFKEPIILSVMVLGIFLYPTYKKVVLITFIPTLFLLFTVLPTYARIFRANAWSGSTSADEATTLALDAALNDDDTDDTNWGFFVYRLSEMDMFTEYVESTPEKVDFYKFDIVQQAAIAIVPRIFWPTKASTEELVMERVYVAGVVSRNAKVSAKPAYIVDAYLSYGVVGIIVALFIYGAVTQLISQKAEILFGGYLLGTALIFSGLFQILWRGLSFEFIVNSVFWSYVTMLLIHKVMVSRNILHPI